MPGESAVAAAVLEMADNRYSADYAKRVAGCKKCKQKFDKGELR